MAIAIFGNIELKVTREKIYTFSDMTRTVGYSVDNQDKKGQKPSTLRKGPKLREATMVLLLDSSLGVSVDAEVEKWMKISESGKPYYLVVGGKRVCPNKMLLLGVNSTKEEFGVSGKRLKAQLALSFQEYVREGKEEKKGSGAGGAGTGMIDSRILNWFTKMFDTKLDKFEENGNVKVSKKKGLKGKVGGTMYYG